MRSSWILSAALALQVTLALPPAVPRWPVGPPDMPAGLADDPQGVEDFLRADAARVEREAGQRDPISALRARRDAWDAAGQPIGKGAR